MPWGVELGMVEHDAAALSPNLHRNGVIFHAAPPRWIGAKARDFYDFTALSNLIKVEQ